MDIFLLIFELMVIGLEVDVRETLDALKLVRPIISFRYWILIIDGNLIQFIIIDTHPQRSISITNK